MSDLIQAIASSIRNREALPKMPDSLSLEEAYEMQRELVSVLADGPVAGLKAGMTAKSGQQAFGLTHPLIGSLYTWGKLEPGAVLDREPGVKLECEIGVVVDGDGEPVTAGPVIEVPRMAWSTPDDAVGTNLTACNIAADRYIVGEQKPYWTEYAECRVKLTRDGDTVLDAPWSDALDGPPSALEWMKEEAAKRGIEIQEGMLLITGACGGIHDAKPGTYLADYGEMGSVEFTVS